MKTSPTPRAQAAELDGAFRSVTGRAASPGRAESAAGRAAGRAGAPRPTGRRPAAGPVCRERPLISLRTSG